MPLTPSQFGTYERLRQVNELARKNPDLAVGLALSDEIPPENTGPVEKLVFTARYALRMLDQENHQGLAEALNGEQDKSFVFRMRALLKGSYLKGETTSEAA